MPDPRAGRRGAGPHAGASADARPPFSRVGTVIATTADGVLTVAMRYGRSTLLVLASDAWIRMATGPATLADIAVHAPETFDKIVEFAKQNL